MPKKKNPQASPKPKKRPAKKRQPREDQNRTAYRVMRRSCYRRLSEFDLRAPHEPPNALMMNDAKLLHQSSTEDRWFINLAKREAVAEVLHREPPF